MTRDEKYINQCISLAKKGLGSVEPNPMVGCIIVYKGKVIGEGYHQQYGEAHAEVNAVNSVADKSLLKQSTLYVNLEPCAHFGKTPPCSDLIIENKIPKVVIGCIDSYSKVSGKGIEKLKKAGIEVVIGMSENKSLDLNKRFFTFHNKQRPFITLKWAETKDGFIDIDRGSKSKQDNWITSPTSKALVHQWRSEEQAILIGTNTALNDNPQLTVREVKGKNPLRVVLDLSLRLPLHLNVFDGSTLTLVVNHVKNEKSSNLEYIKIDSDKDAVSQLLEMLHRRGILSLIVEGGATLLRSFIENNLWDEAKVFIGDKYFEKGLKAPVFNHQPIQKLQFDTDTLNVYVND